MLLCYSKIEICMELEFSVLIYFIMTGIRVLNFLLFKKRITILYFLLFYAILHIKHVMLFHMRMAITSTVAM